MCVFFLFFIYVSVSTNFVYFKQFFWFSDLHRITWLVLHRQILFGLAIAAVSEAILTRTSAEQVPTLHRVAPKHLELVTSFNFWPFMLISALILSVLFFVMLLFSVLTYIPYAVALSMSLLMRS